MTIPTLSPRLRCAASLVRPHSFVADVGTDHAYLPIVLLSEGHIRGGVVSDINRGPIERAKNHISACGMTDRLTPVLCDGLCGIAHYHPEDILILGMGGELIVSILAAAPWVKDPHIRLILQPMTHPEALRAFLGREGYTIVEERLVKEEKIYQILCVEYTGRSTAYTEAELLFGRQNLLRRDPLTRELLCRWEEILSVRKAGKAHAGADTEAEDKLLQQIADWRETHDGT